MANQRYCVVLYTYIFAHIFPDLLKRHRARYPLNLLHEAAIYPDILLLSR